MTHQGLYALRRDLDDILNDRKRSERPRVRSTRPLTSVPAHLLMNELNSKEFDFSEEKS